MKKIYLFAAMAAMLAACSENDLTVEKQAVQQNAEEAAVQFDVYTSRGTTRAGKDGILTTSTAESASHKIAMTTEGFGVFGYYTDGEPYAGNTKPNFFYNQKVTYSGTYGSGNWYYTPIKYWPNEFGNDAVSDEVDRVSLFAYAPWVDVDGLTGLVKNDTYGKDYKNTNIVSMTRNTANGDPYIKYTASMDPENAVDFCYGVAAAAFTSSNSSFNKNDIKAGKPYVDVKKPGTGPDSKIKFDFKHATAQMVVTIDAIVEDKTNDMSSTPFSGNGIDTYHSRIWVRSITFTGVTQKGSFNLNDCEWYDVNGINKITTGSLTVYDGRKDGREANDEASNEDPTTFNPEFIQVEPYKIDGDGKIEKPAKLGVTTTTKNLFNSSSDIDPIFVIPTGEDMTVTIVYDVETYDKNLATFLSDGETRGTTIQNTISKKITGFGKITAGKAYKLNLHLGMRTVDFDAEVDEWINSQSDIDLPANMPTYTAAASPDTEIGKMTIGNTVVSYAFAVRGLDATEDVTPTADGTNVKTTTASDKATGGTANKTNAAGITYATANLDANTTTTNKVGWSKITVGSKGGKVEITQLSAPLGLSVASVSGSTLTLATSGLTDDFASKLNGATIKVERTNNTPATLYDATSTADNMIVPLTGSVTSGDELKIYVKANDSEQTIIYTVI